MKSFYEIIESLYTSFIIITLIILFLLRAVSVDGTSMVPTLQDKEKVITTNLFYTPSKGDVIVIDKNNHFKKPLVKRVIATGGDTIKIDYTTGNVYVNGTLLTEPYISEKITPSNDKLLEMTVPKNHLFVMGDNRNASSDSRDADLGVINEKTVLGKALFIIFPFKNFGKVN